MSLWCSGSLQVSERQKLLGYKLSTVSVAQPTRPYANPFPETTCQGLSDSVVDVSGKCHFTRLNMREQCKYLVITGNLGKEIVKLLEIN